MFNTKLNEILNDIEFEKYIEEKEKTIDLDKELCEKFAESFWNSGDKKITELRKLYSLQSKIKLVDILIKSESPIYIDFLNDYWKNSYYIEKLIDKYQISKYKAEHIIFDISYSSENLFCPSCLTNEFKLRHEQYSSRTILNCSNCNADVDKFCSKEEKEEKIKEKIEVENRLKKIKCGKCQGELVLKVYSFDGYYNIKCRNCNNIIHSLENAEDEFKKLEMKIKLIEEEYRNNEYEKINFCDVETIDKIYLASLLRLCLSEKMDFIESLNDKEGKLTPIIEYTHKILLNLYNKKIITIHPKTNIEAYGDSLDDINMFEAKFNINIKDFDDNQIDNLLNWRFETKMDDSLFAIWKEIAHYECIEYLTVALDRVSFPFNPGKKTNFLIDELLNNFSTAQVYGIIYKCIANTTKYYAENKDKISRRQSANIVIKNIENYGERAKSNNWNLVNYRRDYECKQSVISEFFFNKVLKISDEGFTRKPTSDFNLGL